MRLIKDVKFRTLIVALFALYGALQIKETIAGGAITLTPPQGAGSTVSVGTVGAQTGNFDFIDAGTVRVNTALDVASGAVNLRLLSATNYLVSYVPDSVTTSTVCAAGVIPAAALAAGDCYFAVGNQVGTPTVRFTTNAMVPIVDIVGSGSSDITMRNHISSAANAADGISCTNECEVQFPDTKIAEVGTQLELTAAGGVDVSASIRLTDVLTDTATDPTVVACSGTAASITAANGSAAFQFDVGTSCTGESTAVITLPAATTGWVCNCSSTTADRMIQQKAASTTTAVTMTNVVISTGAAGDFTDGADLFCMCRGY